LPPVHAIRPRRRIATSERGSMDIKVFMLTSLFSMIAALYHLSNWRVAKTDRE
jgi:hypothetical protein